MESRPISKCKILRQEGGAVTESTIACDLLLVAIRPLPEQPDQSTISHLAAGLFDVIAAPASTRARGGTSGASADRVHKSICHKRGALALVNQCVNGHDPEREALKASCSARIQGRPGASEPESTQISRVPDQRGMHRAYAVHVRGRAGSEDDSQGQWTSRA